MLSGAMTYIFLNCVRVLNAEDALTHQNSLLLIAKSLWIHTLILFQPYEVRIAQLALL